LASEGIDDWKFALGLAKLRRDGFVSIDASDTPGTLTTRPLSFAGKTLHVNAAVEKDGELRVARLKTDGTALEGHGMEDCIPFRGDSPDAVVSWKHQNDQGTVKETSEHVRLEFQLRRARIYAFWIDE
jgi:hypothetical protein